MLTVNRNLGILMSSVPSGKGLKYLKCSSCLHGCKNQVCINSLDTWFQLNVLETKDQSKYLIQVLVYACPKSGTCSPVIVIVLMSFFNFFFSFLSVFVIVHYFVNRWGWLSCLMNSFTFWILGLFYSFHNDIPVGSGWLLKTVIGPVEVKFCPFFNEWLSHGQSCHTSYCKSKKILGLVKKEISSDRTFWD